MADEKEERWQQLCRIASVEQDPRKLAILIAEIVHLLDERAKQQASSLSRD